MLANNRQKGRRMENENCPHVVPKAERGKFSAEYKERILTEVDACTQRGQIGALLRHEGLYSSHLEKWRTRLCYEVPYTPRYQCMFGSLGSLRTSSLEESF